MAENIYDGMQANSARTNPGYAEYVDQIQSRFAEINSAIDEIEMVASRYLIPPISSPSGTEKLTPDTSSEHSQHINFLHTVMRDQSLIKLRLSDFLARIER